MKKIINIKAREILDSRGYPTVECDVILENNIVGRSAVPSGASKGTHECVEIRDENKNRFNGKGVLNAVNNINNIISKSLVGLNIIEQEKIDNILIKLDGTKDKSNLGVNSILPVSLSCAKAASYVNKNFLYEYLNPKAKTLPVPLINLINGGQHADNNLDFQEFMIVPIGAKSFKESLEISCEIFYRLKSILSSKGLNTNVGDEGGFAPNLKSNKEAIELLLESISKSQLTPGKEIFIALDVAANEIFNGTNYALKSENKIFSSQELSEYYNKLINEYPIFSIEDALSEDDWNGWKYITKLLGKDIQLVGDDLFVTNYERLKKGIKENISNSILVKLNQIGTLSETLKVIKLAKENNYSFIISHRSGETEDCFISDLSVSTNSSQIKTGSLSRTERLSKYNQLLRIEENLGNQAEYSGKNILKFKK